MQADLECESVAPMGQARALTYREYRKFQGLPDFLPVDPIHLKKELIAKLPGIPAWDTY